jgi:hypothetical protein
MMMRRARPFRKPPPVSGEVARLRRNVKVAQSVGLGVQNVTGISVRLALVTTLTLAAAPEAAAGTTAEIVRNWGLLGSWATDCSVPPDRANPALIYEITPDERVMLRRNFGTGKDEQEISTAEISSDGVLRLRIFFPAFKQTRDNGIVMQSDGSIRAIYSRNDKDEYTIRDGSFVASGNPTVALHKCVPRG